MVGMGDLEPSFAPRRSTLASQCSSVSLLVCVSRLTAPTKDHGGVLGENVGPEDKRPGEIAAIVSIRPKPATRASATAGVMANLSQKESS
jgi:hypothetical protein